MDKNNEIETACLISHKCYERVGALRFAKHREWYVEHLRVTAKKYSLPIFNYLIASDGVYFLCAAIDPIVISNMMQVLQSSASKKLAHKRGGESSMWRGRFNATLVHGDTLMKQCMLLLDLHMVASQQIIHPAEWQYSGWKELAGIKKRYKVISTKLASKVWEDTGDAEKFREKYVRAVETCCQSNSFCCLEVWTDTLAVGEVGWIKQMSYSIPNTFKSINTLPQSASPLSFGDVEIKTLTVSKKRRRGYWDMISKKLDCMD